MPDILHAIQISAAADSIFPLVSTAKGFSPWWAEDVSQSGSFIELGFFNRKTLYRLRVSSQTAPAHIDWLCETGAESSNSALPPPMSLFASFMPAGMRLRTTSFPAIPPGAN